MEKLRSQLKILVLMMESLPVNLGFLKIVFQRKFLILCVAQVTNILLTRRALS